MKQRPPGARKALDRALEAFEVDQGVLDYVESLGTAGRAGLVRVLSSRQKQVSSRLARAAYILGTLGHQPAFKPLVRLLRHDSESVRASAVYALGKVGGPHAVEPLLEVLEGSDIPETTRAHSIQCLAEIGDETALARLESIATEAPSRELAQVARAAAATLRTNLAALGK